MASTLVAMASNLLAMASNLLGSQIKGFFPVEFNSEYQR